MPTLFQGSAEDIRDKMMNLMQITHRLPEETSVNHHLQSRVIGVMTEECTGWIEG